MRQGRLAEMEAYQQPPHLVEKELSTKLGFGKDIFVGSTIDMWSEEIPDEWIERVLQHCYNADEQASDLFAGMVSAPRRYKRRQGVERFHSKRKSYSRLPNRFLFQSKNPARFKGFLDFMPEHTTLGTTIETDDVARYMVDAISKAPDPFDRVLAMESYDRYDKEVMVSIEPIMGFDLKTLNQWIRFISPGYVSIGCETKGVFERLGIPQPSHEKVIELVEAIDSYTEVRLKPNLKDLPGRESKQAFTAYLEEAGGIWPPYEE